MARPLLHADLIPLDEAVGNAVSQGGQYGVITDAGIVAANTNAGLQAFANTFTGHSDLMPVVAGIVRAIQVGGTTGSLSDANILNETTLAGLIANTYGTVGKVSPLLI